MTGLWLSSFGSPKNGTAREVFGFVDLSAGESLVQDALGFMSLGAQTG